MIQAPSLDPTLREIAPYVLNDPRIREQLTPAERQEVDAVVVGIGGGVSAAKSWSAIEHSIAREFRQTRMQHLRQGIRVTKAQRVAINRGLSNAAGALARSRTLSIAANTAGTGLTMVGIIAASAEAAEGSAGVSKPATLAAAAAALYVYPPAGLVVSGALLILESAGRLDEMSLATDDLFH